MPKLNKKTTRRLAIRALANKLDELREVLHKMVLELDGLEKRLYTTGLDERGPIMEREDTIPF